MSDGTSIEWTDASWNPIRSRLAPSLRGGWPPDRDGWHCEHVSAGCKNCYAESINRRLGTKQDYKPGLRKDVEIFVHEKALLQPLKWRKPRKIFVCSMTDLFADFVSDEMIDRVFAIMALCPQHIFQVLTKRPARMREYLTDRASGRPIQPALGDGTLGYHPFNCEVKPPANVWLGVSVEDQAAAKERIPQLMATPAAVRWLSCEPLLGFVVLSEAWHGESALDAECWGECNWCRNGPDFPPLHNCHAGRGDWEKSRSGVDWVVVGGESGLRARPMDAEWVRLIRDECAEAGVPFLFKQWGSNPIGACKPPRGTKGGRLLDGVQHDGYPA